MNASAPARHAAVALLAAALASPCAAQPALDDLAGGWRFETAPQHIYRCVIRGHATALKENRGLRIEIEATETCPSGEIHRAEETCTGQFAGARLMVSCKVVAAEPRAYNADQFALRIDSATQMTGRLFDGDVWNDTVTWRRDDWVS